MTVLIRAGATRVSETEDGTPAGLARLTSVVGGDRTLLSVAMPGPGGVGDGGSALEDDAGIVAADSSEGVTVVCARAGFRAGGYPWAVSGG